MAPETVGGDGSNQPRPLSSLGLRPMMEEDLREIAAIEKVTFPDPWTHAALAFELKENPFCRCLVAEQAGAVAGYAFVWVVYEVAHLVNIAVASEFRGRGFGEALLSWAMDTARLEGAESIYLEVREGNAPAIALYEKYGFQPRGRKENYYRDGATALLMDAPLPRGT